MTVLGAKLGKDSVNLAFAPVSKPYTHKLYILKNCTNIVCAVSGTQVIYIYRVAASYCCYSSDSQYEVFNDQHNLYLVA